MIAPIRFECTCGAKLKATPDRIGDRFACPKCGEQLWVPDPKRLIEDASRPTSSPNRQKTKAKHPATVWTAGTLFSMTVGACCVCGIIGAIVNPDPTRNDLRRQREVLNSVDRDASQSSKRAVSPDEQLAQIIRDALGTTNRNVPKVDAIDVNDGTAFVRFSIDDNLTNGLIRSGAKIEIANVLKAIAKSNLPIREIKLVGTFSMLDKFGHSEESPVVQVVYHNSTIERINWNGFLISNVFDIADEKVIHPVFQ